MGILTLQQNLLPVEAGELNPQIEQWVHKKLFRPGTIPFRK
ncbi:MULTISPECIES: hypothetical protein [unclassified Nostoc]|nr:hypothetical protein [Nostoc sp. S13]MDF5738079.1 hypothetical protein [Nostoc sp. S13]